MNVIKICIILSVLFASGCTVFLGEPSKRVQRFSDWKLCTELADKTFKYHSEWHWAITAEIKKRHLNESQKCKATFTSRMNRFVVKRKIKPVSFEDALSHNFG